MGHGWMSWPHSYAEVGWRPFPGDEMEPPNPYSNFFDIMSQLDFFQRSSAGTTPCRRHSRSTATPPDGSRPDDVALHLNPGATYTLSRAAPGRLPVPGDPFRTAPRLHHAGGAREPAPNGSGCSGRTSTTPRFRGRPPSRAATTACSSTATTSRPEPARRRGSGRRCTAATIPDYLADVGWGRDDYSLVSRRRRRGTSAAA